MSCSWIYCNECGHCETSNKVFACPKCGSTRIEWDYDTDEMYDHDHDHDDEGDHDEN